MEEERKYKNNEDFTAFIRQLAQKRRIANMFMKIKKEIVIEEAQKNEEDAKDSGQVQEEENKIRGSLIEE